VIEDFYNLILSSPDNLTKIDKALGNVQNTSDDAIKNLDTYINNVAKGVKKFDVKSVLSQISEIKDETIKINALLAAFGSSIPDELVTTLRVVTVLDGLSEVNNVVS
jgi:DNA anti-recombination protein RmuC